MFGLHIGYRVLHNHGYIQISQVAKSQVWKESKHARYWKPSQLPRASEVDLGIKPIIAT